jgi:hypothetical protein
MRFPNKSHRLPVALPFQSERLAEFCGIMLGDGGITNYQVRITLHTNEQEYARFVAQLAEELFSVKPRCYIRKDKKAFDLVLSRIEIVEFLVGVCGLVQGNKVIREICIPAWIKKEERYRIACMRGMFDTDGSVFTHTYAAKGKKYSYKKLGFTSCSLPLLRSAREILVSEGIHCRYGSRSDIRIESTSSVRNYFKVFGSHNPKHLYRYRY